MSDTQLTKSITTFSHAPFEYLYGYANALVIFRTYLACENSILKSVCSKLKACIATSETLFEANRKLLEKVFCAPVISKYGCTELEVITFRNLNGAWQINSSDLHLDVLDKTDKVLP